MATLNNDSGQRTTVWMETAPMPAFQPLTQSIQTDVCIVGAGIAGLTTAYLLAKEGRLVTVIDDGPVAGGETARTTAHLASALDDRFSHLEYLHGEKGARLAAESHMAAIDKIESIVNEEKINCDFSRLNGYLFVLPGHDTNVLEKELAAARRAGHSQVIQVNQLPVETLASEGPALRFPNQGQFHVLKYLQGLVEAIQRLNGQIYSYTHAQEIKGGKESQVTTDKGHVISANHLVVATNSPINDLVTMHTKQAPYRTYVVGAQIPKGSVPQALYWDTADPYHYIRIQEGEAYDLLIVGGEDHKTGQEDNHQERLNCLREWSYANFPMITGIEYEWSGQVMEPVDSLAFLGRNPGDENVYIITGDSGHGMTHATIGAMLITDLIEGRENEWEELYKPSRISLKATKEFLRENLNVAGYYTELVTAGISNKREDIAVGCGAIVSDGLKKVAVYRDEQGTLHECSALCTHLAGVVTWNDVEKTWDCPLHGSRFDPHGRVLNGPAVADLPKQNEEAPQGERE